MCPPLTTSATYGGSGGPCVEEVRPDVPLQVVDADQAGARGERHALGRRHPDQQRPHQTGADRHRDPVDVAEPREPGRLERLGQERVQRLHVGARRHLGHDPAEPLVQVHLGGDEVRAHA